MDNRWLLILTFAYKGGATSGATGGMDPIDFKQKMTKMYTKLNLAIF